MATSTGAKRAAEGVEEETGAVQRGEDLSPGRRRHAFQLTLIETGSRRQEVIGDCVTVATPRSASHRRDCGCRRSHSPQAYEKYRDQIHEAGWPEGSVDAKSNDLSEAILRQRAGQDSGHQHHVRPRCRSDVQGQFSAGERQHRARVFRVYSRRGQVASQYRRAADVR